MRNANVEFFEEFNSQLNKAVDHCTKELHQLKENLIKLPDYHQNMLSINPQEFTSEEINAFAELISCSHYMTTLKIMQNAENIESMKRSGMTQFDIDECWEMILNKFKACQSQLMTKIFDHIILKYKGKTSLSIASFEISTINSEIKRYKKNQGDLSSITFIAQNFYLKKINSFYHDAIKIKPPHKLGIYIANETIECSKNIIFLLNRLKNKACDLTFIIKFLDDYKVITYLLGEYSSLASRGFVANDQVIRKVTQFNFKCLDVFKIINHITGDINTDINKYMHEFYLSIGLGDAILCDKIIEKDETNKIKSALSDSFIVQIFSSALIISPETLFDDYFLAITDTTMRVENLKSLFKYIFSDGVDLNSPFYIIAENFCIDNIYTKESALLQMVLNPYIAPSQDHTVENEWRQLSILH